MDAMYCERKITGETIYVGASDRRLSLFENVFPLDNGVSYNAYLVLDEKTVLMDTVDRSVSGQFYENLTHALAGRSLDYLIVNHMEPDHCACIEELILRYPAVKIVGNSKTHVMLSQFFRTPMDDRAITVSEGDTLCTGRHTFSFHMAPMVHWPEAMVTFDITEGTLFSADAFGTFGALSGNLFADELPFDDGWMNEARRYYTNIVGKYGTQVQALLKKAATLDIARICPLHGPVWRKDIGTFLEKYDLWSRYAPEQKGVMIAYASVYGGTEQAATLLACRLAEKGVRGIRMYDVSKTHPSVIVAECFRLSHLVFASTTYNAGIFCNMETVLHDIAAHNLKNRTVALIENGSWAPTSGGLMRNIFESLDAMRILSPVISLRSTLREQQREEVDALASAIAEELVPSSAIAKGTEKVEKSAFFKLSYGLFVLAANDGTKDNACIINTAVQLTDKVKRISIAVNKANYTHDIIKSTGVFTLSILSTDAPFSLFQRFGFASGRDTDKFQGFSSVARAENGLPYLTEYANAFLSARVVAMNELDTHTQFIAEVTEAQTLSDAPSVTYAYYFDRIKPKPLAAAEKKTGWVCKVCGYVYEGEELPPDFICPLCKHGAEDFERIQ